jgi:gliding motility-associated-like protein
MKPILTGLLAILGSVTYVAAQIPTDGLIASYPFNSNANDESGHGNHANFYFVSQIADRCGFSNSAFYFNGVGNRISLPPENFVGLNEYTYSLWFKVNSLPSPSIDGWIMLAVGSATESYEQAISIHPNGALFGGSYNIGNNPVASFTETAPVQTNRWIHAVLIRDNIYLRIFINGQLMANVANYDSLTNNQPANYGSGDYAAIIGGRSNLTKQNYFDGALDDVLIYNRALSAEEVLRLYYSKCTLSEINGEREVCQGQQQVPYYVQTLYSTADYSWNYSGNGATIQGDGDSISIDFSNNATSGSLTVTITGNGIDEQSRTVPVMVYSLPSDAGPITGDNEVCTGQSGVSYTVPVIQEAVSYSWDYDGSGATISGNSNSIIIAFSENSTSGNLTVTGTNVCGNGSASPAYPVIINQLPAEAGVLTGSNVVCENQENVQYSVPAIQHATGYLWSYSGSGTTISGNSRSISIDFAENATSGNLTVTGQNNCGEGLKSANFFITVNPCEEKPVINIPNSFSPNGDGINDYFVISGLTENSTLAIFNRNGKKLIELSNYQNDWDGKDQEGGNLESGTYWYVLTVSGIPEECKGFVYLKR